MNKVKQVYIKEEYLKKIKMIAVQQDKKIQEVANEALEQYFMGV